MSVRHLHHPSAWGVEKVTKKKKKSKRTFLDQFGILIIVIFLIIVDRSFVLNVTVTRTLGRATILLLFFFLFLIIILFDFIVNERVLDRVPLLVRHDWLSHTRVVR